VNLDLRPKDLDLDLTISESEDLDLDLDLDLEEEDSDLDLDLDLPPWDLTTSLDKTRTPHRETLRNAMHFWSAAATVKHIDLISLKQSNPSRKHVDGSLADVTRSSRVKLIQSFSTICQRGSS